MGDATHWGDISATRMTPGHTTGTLDGMTAKVTLSFSDHTIAEARRWAALEGVSLSAWIDRAARERAMREIFTAHAAAVRRAGLDDEARALADERECALVSAELRGQR